MDDRIEAAVERARERVRVGDVSDDDVDVGIRVRLRSITRAWAPAAISSATTWRPMKPEPPVTNTRLPFRS